MDENTFFSLISFVALDQIPNIKICHIIVIEHPGVIEGRRCLIDMDAPDSEGAAEYGSIDNDGDSSDEEDESVLGQAGVIIGVTQSVTYNVEKVQQVMKYYSLSSYMLKPPSLLIHGFNKNKKA